jgi:hypothetical protein
MALAEELNEAFQRKMQGTPWVLRVMTGEGDPTQISTDEFTAALAIAIQALHENILRLAREIDASR